MTSSRAKGLSYVREVKEILKRLGHEVDGPMHKVMRLPSGFVPVHTDIFGVWDLISFDKLGYHFHQVTTDHNRTVKIGAILDKGMSGQVWGRCKEGNRVAYRTYYVYFNGQTEKLETYYLK